MDPRRPRHHDTGPGPPARAEDEGAAGGLHQAKPGHREVDPQVDALLRAAIGGKRVIRFVLGRRERIAEPHDYGIHRGQAMLLAYQIGGESTSGRLPGWRWVVLAKASEFRMLDDTFAGGRDVPTGVHSSWDALFARVAK